MQKVAVLSHKSFQEDLLEFLQDEGVMEISPNEETEDIDHPVVQYEEAEVKFAIDFLLPSASKEALKAVKNPGTEEEIRQSAMAIDFREIILSCKALEDTASDLLAEKQHLQTEKEKLTPWKELPLRLHERETEETVLLFGTCPADSAPAFQEQIAKELPQSEVLTVPEISGNVHIAILILKKDRGAFEQAAARFSWTEVQLPSVERTPLQELRRIEQAFRVLDGKETELTHKKTDLAKHLPNLVRLAHFLNWMDEKQSVRSEFAQTEQTVKLSGWIPAKKFEGVQKDLQKKFPAVALLIEEPKDDEEPPMQIWNSDVLAPFEAVTRLYGLPAEGEMDPTRPLLPFFIVYFGLCLTDAGYGIVLTLIMLTAILKFKLTRQGAKLVWLLFYGGIATFIAGVPFGGWFGLLPEQAPSALTYINEAGNLRFLGQLWMPTKDVDFFRNLTIILGITQILFGITLSGYWKAIHGKVKEAILEDFAVHFLLLALLAKYVLGLPYADLALVATLALFIWGRGAGKWWIRPLTGVLGSISFTIGLLSNTLSYLRILALGLATGALAFAINQIAIVMYDLMPIFLGIPIFIMIVLFGHLMSIALNCLGAFVHSGRLQFIEFFGQFFQGGGREFNPFRRSIRSIA